MALQAVTTESGFTFTVEGKEEKVTLEVWKGERYLHIELSQMEAWKLNSALGLALGDIATVKLQ